ncbi:hypothetical protein TIFTF001_031536 [Ficus carica]|uniref:Uncharacterized protein n=1 Tax=Ficus carica TaxID=3494 RepID=A0AA88DV55_FICCA|nr:hypothetical protein TIFTF001_031536 [Ficus carica]
MGGVLERVFDIVGVVAVVFVSARRVGAPVGL